MIKVSFSTIMKWSKVTGKWNRNNIFRKLIDILFYAEL